jgi:hypothetical protein
MGLRLRVGEEEEEFDKRCNYGEDQGIERDRRENATASLGDR